MSSFYFIVFWLSLCEKTILKGISVQVIYSILFSLYLLFLDAFISYHEFYLGGATPPPPGAQGGPWGQAHPL